MKSTDHLVIGDSGGSVINITNYPLSLLKKIFHKIRTR